MKKCFGVLLAVIIFSGGMGMGESVSFEPGPLKGKEVSVIPVGKEKVQQAVFSPDGKRLLVCGQDVSFLWEIPEGRKVADLRHQPVGEAPSWWNHFSFSGDGTRILTQAVSARSNGSFCTVWDALTGAPVGKTQLLHMSRVQRVCLTPNARLLLGGCWQVHDVTAEGIGSSMRPIPVGGGNMVCSPDSRKGAFFDPEGGVSVWDLEEARKIWSIPARSKYAPLAVAQFSEDSSLIFVADQLGVTAEIYDLKNRRELAKTDEEEKNANDGLCFGASGFSMMCFDAKAGKMRKADFPVPLMREQWKKRKTPTYRERHPRHPSPLEESSPGILYVTKNGRYAVMAQFSGCQLYNYEGTLLIWDAEKKDESGKIVHWEPFISWVTLSPGEHYLHIHGGNTSPEGIISFSTGHAMKVPGSILAFSADDSMVAWLDGENVRIWEISEGERTRS